MKKAVFLDRDGTINEDKNYLYEIDKFKFLPGVLEGLKRFKEAGYLLIIVTNQSGIGRGFYTEEQYLELEDWMRQKMRECGAEPDDVFYCPHLPDAPVLQYRKKCLCRKPNMGLFEEAIKKWDIDVASSIVIGDKIRDLTLCKNGLTKGFLVYSPGDKEVFMENISYITGGIWEVANIVLG